MKTYRYLPWLLLTWGAYALIGLLAPIDLVGASRYGISTLGSYLIRISFQIPIFILWWSIFFGTFRFARYTKSIEESPEGAAFRSISQGLSVLLVGLIIPSYVGLLSQYYPSDMAVLKFVSLTNLYTAIVLTFIAFTLFLKGGIRLMALVPERLSLLKTTVVNLVIIAVFGALYTYTVFHNPDRLAVVTSGVRQPAYFLPSDTWILFAAVIPYLVAWTVGLFSIAYIRHFTRFVKGVVYQRAFSAVGRGLIAIIVTSLGLQLLTQAGAFFAQVGLTEILVVIYLLLIAIAVGYLFIAWGAKELGKLESA